VFNVIEIDSPYLGLSRQDIVEYIHEAFARQELDIAAW